MLLPSLREGVGSFFHFASEIQNTNLTVASPLLHYSEATQQTHSPDNNVVTCLEFSRWHCEGLPDTSVKTYSLGAAVRQGYRNVKELCEHCVEIVCL